MTTNVLLLQMNPNKMETDSLKKQLEQHAYKGSRKLFVN